MNAPGNPPSRVDQAYHQHTGSVRFARRISRVARQRVHDCFMDALRPKPGDRILDIGTSDDVGPDSNMLEQAYPHRRDLTCASLSDGRSILAAYPGVQHVRIVAGQPLPFESNAFEIVYSNAVLEHVGSRPQQRAFIEEMCRVAPRRFLVVPNRGFPVESHTCLPLLHYLPQAWFRKLLRGTRYDYWSREENLNYLSASELRQVWPRNGHPILVTRAGIGFGPWKSNLVAYQA